MLAWALAGQTAKDVFNEYNDSFIHNIMMTNMERYELESTGVSEPQEDSEDPFIGTWEAIDSGDGSNMQLSISEDNGVYSIEFHDEVAGSCGLDSAGKTIGSVGTGTGLVKENVLSTDISLWCMSEPRRGIEMISILSCGCLPKPVPGWTMSSFKTLSAPKLMRDWSK